MTALPGSRQTVVALSLIMVAGLLSTWIHARGELGPMVSFGRSDANITAGQAWQQLPLYLALSVGAVAGSSAIGMVVRAAALALGGVLATWAMFLTLAALGNVKNGPGFAGIGAAVCLLALDVLIIGVLAEPLWRAAERPEGRPPAARD